MPSTLEQRRPGQTQEINEPREGEILEEYTNEKLQEFIEKAETRISADEARILGLPDELSLNSIGLDKEKASSIFTGRGFGERIKSVKDRITTLADRTRERVARLTRQEAETEEVFNNISLDEYMAKRSSSGVERVKDKLRIVQLKSKGSKDAKRALGFVHYIEEKAAGYEFNTILVKDSQVEKKRESYEREGYTVFIDPSCEGMTRLNVGKDVPFHFEMRDASQIEKLIHTQTDPVEFFERLRGLGYKMAGYDVTQDAEKVKKFLDNPHIISFLKKLEPLKGKISLTKTLFLFEDSYEDNILFKLAELDAEKDILNEATLKNLSTISEIVGYPFELESIGVWSDIASDPEILDLLLLARDNGSKFEKHNDRRLIAHLKNFKDAGIAGGIVSLVKKGFDPHSFALDQMGSYSMRPSVDMFAQSVLELTANPDFQTFMEEVAAEMGVKPSVDPEEYKKFRLCFSRPKEALRLLRAAKELEVPVWETSYALEQLFGNDEVAETITQPDFVHFLSYIKDTGYKRTTFDLLHMESELFKLYTNENFKEKIAKKENRELAKYINLFREVGWAYNIIPFENLTEIPRARELLITLEQKFGHTYSFMDNISVFQNKETVDEFLKPETETLFNELKKTGYAFRLTEEDIKFLTESSSKQDLIRKFSDPETIQFIQDIGYYVSPLNIETAAEVEPSLRPIVKILVTEFAYDLKYRGNSDAQRLIELKENPQVLETARAMKKIDLDYNPIIFYHKLKMIGEKNIIDVLTQYKDSRPIQLVILHNLDAITAEPKEKISAVFAEILENSESKSLRDKQMIRGEIVGSFLQDEKYELFIEMGGDYDDVEKITQFVEKHNISGKGRTIATLLSMREYEEGENFSGLLSRVEKRLDEYEELLERATPRNIPEGLKASIGMEYEITQSTAEEYSHSTGGNLAKDMGKIAYFANVGEGKDAIFEIATKPSDNPYLMLLEMRLLQDLECIDFNFRQPGYEQGARGYHITIGGERGVKITRDVNFLQNALVMSGWGGINAGRDVNQLARAGRNIRQRDMYDTRRVFENVKPAVEFRSLSLDAWEPFERAVETSYLGAIAVQAFEKHVIAGSEQKIPDVKAKNFEGFYQLLKERNLIKESTDDDRIKQIIFEWEKLQQGVLADLSDHNEHFLENEIYGYEDEKGNWIEPEDFGGAENKKRFESILGGEPPLEGTSALVGYAEKTRIDPDALFQEASPYLANKCTAITNIFIKPSRESGGDRVNTGASLNTTKIGRTIESDDPQARYKSFFDTKGKGRNGYYYIQGGSERMILHKIQMRLLEFNTSIRDIIS